MAGNGRRVAGIIAVVVAVLAGIADILFYMRPHPHRWIPVLIVCGVLLILGIVLVAVSSRKPPQTQVQ